MPGTQGNRVTTNKFRQMRTTLLCNGTKGTAQVVMIAERTGGGGALTFLGFSSLAFLGGIWCSAGGHHSAAKR